MPDRYIRRLNGPRGSALMFLGALIAWPHAVGTSGVFTPPAPIPTGLVAMTFVLPLPVYSAAWAFTGLLCVIAAWVPRRTRQNPTMDRFAWAAVACMFVVWSFAYGAGWLLSVAGLAGTDITVRAYVFAFIYLGVALLVGVCARALPGRHWDRRSSLGLGR